MDELPSRKQKFWSSLEKIFKIKARDDKSHSFKEIVESNGNELIDEEKREMVDSILDFRDTIAREIMVPRIDIVCTGKDSTVEELVNLIAEQGHSRIPIFDNTIDNIIGIVYAKDILLHLMDGDKNADLTGKMRKPYFIPESKKIYSLLKEFQKNKVHIAIVVDEYGGTAGIVTMEDVLEEIVGEIQDEYDSEEPLYVFLDDQTVSMDAKINIEEINELLKIELPTEEDFETVGGLIFDRLGRVPEMGEEIYLDDICIKVKSIIGHRIEKVIISKTSNEEIAESEE